ncbi:MAG: phosphohistidine phosphatase SixA [Pyrobaculum sp.]
MRLYLVQHGEAKVETEDPRRPLTERGAREVRKIAEFLKKAGVRVEKIFHSGKLRAIQTAEIFAEVLGAEVEQTEGLDPLSDPKIWAERVERLTSDVMIVGHLPHLGKLVSYLVAKNEELKIVEFRYAGVVCLERGGDRWAVIWAVRPELLPPDDMASRQEPHG